VAKLDRELVAARNNVARLSFAAVALNARHVELTLNVAKDEIGSGHLLFFGAGLKCQLSPIPAVSNCSKQHPFSIARRR